MNDPGEGMPLDRRGLLHASAWRNGDINRRHWPKRRQLVPDLAGIADHECRELVLVYVLARDTPDVFRRRFFNL